MSRIEGVPPNKANPLVRIIYSMVRRELGRMTGKRELTPDIPLRAHRTSLLLGYGMFENAVARKPRVDAHLRGLVQLKSAVMQGCEMCRDIGSQQALAWGVSEEQVGELYRYRESHLFDETERLVLDLAVGMTLTPVRVSDELFAQLRDRFDEAELVELVNLVALENLRSRFNAAFALPSVGFNEGATCARMEGPQNAVEAEPTPAEAPPLVTA